VATLPELSQPTTWVTILVLTILASMSWWLESVVEEPLGKLVKSKSNKPDYYMEQFTLKAMGIEGKVKYSVHGQSLVHYPTDNSSEVQTPHVEIYRDNGPPWIVDARSARVNDDGTKTILTGNVAIRREGTDTLSDIQIYTDRLLLMSDKDYAETKEPITIIRDDNTIKAIGMRAWLKLGKLHLLSKVRGRYE